MRYIIWTNKRSDWDGPDGFFPIASNSIIDAMEAASAAFLAEEDAMWSVVIFERVHGENNRYRPLMQTYDGYQFHPYSGGGRMDIIRGNDGNINWAF